MKVTCLVYKQIDTFGKVQDGRGLRLGFGQKRWEEHGLWPGLYDLVKSWGAEPSSKMESL